MDDEKLNNAQKLANTINTLTIEVKKWEAAQGILQGGIEMQYNSCNTLSRVLTQFINFDVLKALTIYELTKQLNQAKAEFEAL